jgi:secreted trypsin-like serine protease
MRLLIFFLVVILCKQGDGEKYECDTTALCGCSISSTILTRIVGGENAADWSWSWAVSLRYYGSHFCGASILSPSFVITAGHCVADITSATPLSILAGSTTLTPSSSNPFYQIRSIAEIYKHSGYSASTLINDIAILRLSTPLNMTTGKIKPICLPTGLVSQPNDNINMTAVGWGVTDSSSTKVSQNLLQVTVQSISSTVPACQRSLSDSRWQFCAGLLQGGKGNTSILNIFTDNNCLFFLQILVRGIVVDH